MFPRPFDRRVPVLADRDGCAHVQCRFAGRCDGTTNRGVDAKVRALIDTGKNHINVFRQMVDRDTYAVGGRSVYRKPMRFLFPKNKWTMLRDAMPAFTALPIRSHNDDFVIRPGKSPHRSIQRHHAWRVDPVVIGQ